MKVKICGITNVTDAMAAANAGADAIGLMFFEGSPRHISNIVASEIVRVLPPRVVKVGVFVNPSEDRVRQAMECGIDTLQFHGEESPDFCRRFGVRVIKAFRIRDATSLGMLAKYQTDGWLLDSYVADQLGGTGAQFNWNLAAEAVKRHGHIWLAGGLTPENVAKAVQQVRPYGVDVSSGVESVPGKKDHLKLKLFIEAAHSTGQ